MFGHLNGHWYLKVWSFEKPKHINNKNRTAISL